MSKLVINLLFWLNFGFWAGLIILGLWIIYKRKCDTYLAIFAQFILSIVYGLIGIFCMITMMNLIIGG